MAWRRSDEPELVPTVVPTTTCKSGTGIVAGWMCGGSGGDDCDLFWGEGVARWWQVSCSISLVLRNTSAIIRAYPAGKEAKEEVMVGGGERGSGLFFTGWAIERASGSGVVSAERKRVVLDGVNVFFWLIRRWDVGLLALFTEVLPLGLTRCRRTPQDRHCRIARSARCRGGHGTWSARWWYPRAARRAESA